ncbi:hypothetical protein NADFUDRAFT_73878 [Nadsonia fulvescens var. elongata DSM 6958]|uniref:Glutamine amidotransferase type-2 domain-containing protein n=1 Tax=Nadsonia fulvescens var. elongata DSM 6958 TaxID=857566 RepID=A0A1E3PMR9_9ASCO|nr:hypothetical protein NADFUDRAFT_73878 [Nadsonia fulvescens var. elongata DSM 6958]
MCGILLCLSDTAVLAEKQRYLSRYIVPSIRLRGPTAQNELTVNVKEIGSQLWLYSSVLSLRDPFTPQPVNHGAGILQFNGELYNPELAGNDTQWVIDQFEAQGVLKSIESFRGEFAFTYYDKLAHKIWFGRDCVGRRSLMYQYDPATRDGLIVSSLGPQGDPSFNLNEQGIWKEVIGGQIMCLNLNTMLMDSMPFSYQGSIEKSLVYPYPSIVDSNSTDKALIPELTKSLYKKLFLAVEKRVLTVPHVPISILFSGGIDCTLLAHFVDCIIPEGETIDLFNVAFENLRTGAGYDTPDRKLGRRSWAELEQLYQNRSRDCPSNNISNSNTFSAKPQPRFRFVEVNVPYDDMSAAKSTVQTLMYPKDSVMDLSIAIAFYFASRGLGDSYINRTSDSLSIPPSLELESENYNSPSPVLISGLGADELFGGYTRHTTTLSRNGYKSLCEELQMDFNRLHERNLGRDDRVCACWGKEVRYPFLDEDVIAWALGQCPLDLKFILRQVAEFIGLYQVSKEKKRAIQFGAKSAKMEIGTGKIKGTDRL